jgi:hypothetical protein
MITRVFLIVLGMLAFLIACIPATDSKATQGIIDKSKTLCAILQMDLGTQLLATYQNYPSMEDAVNSVYGDTLYGLVRWDQAATFQDFSLNWYRDELQQKNSYILPLLQEQPLRLMLRLDQERLITMDAIIECMGTPDYYAFETFSFSSNTTATGLNERLDIVNLFYMERDIQIQLLKARSKVFLEEGTELYLDNLTLFPPNQMAPGVDYPLHLLEWTLN